MDTQDLHTLREGSVVRDAHPRIAEGTQILRREERQAADIPVAAGPIVIVILGADRLRCILDDAQPVAPRDVQQRQHVGDLTVQMHGHERFDTAARVAVDERVSAPLAVLLDEGLHGGWGEIEADRIDVAEGRTRPGARDGPRGREERKRRGDHFIARPNLQRHERQQQRIRAGRDADAVATLAVGGDGGLQLFDRGAEDEPLAGADLVDDGLDLSFERLVLGLQIKQRHLHRRLRLGGGHGGSPGRSPALRRILAAAGRAAQRL